MSERAEKFLKLLSVMKRLREPNGCPWDREQNYMSLRKYILEESYELIEAIESGDIGDMTEECGDLLLQVVFVSTIAEERNDFDIKDVLDYISDKLIRRHPHVFGDVTVNDSEEVVKNWEQIKIGERKNKAKKDTSILAGVPRSMPALLRANRIQERAAKLGFDWEKEDLQPLYSKVGEELAEVKQAVETKDKAAVSDEIGDLLFAVVNLSRHLDNDPEISLHNACAKFSSRFRYIENAVSASEKPWSDYNLDELDKLWEEAKAAEKSDK